MKKLIILLAILVADRVHAQSVLEVIRAGVKKAIVAVDLKIQRLQHRTMLLQHAQKKMENVMSATHLREISEWVQRQRKLYDDYFQELWKVKRVLLYFHRVKEIVATQAVLVHEFKNAWGLFQVDKNFTTDELDYMFKVYDGMFRRCLQQVEQLFLVTDAFTTQMSDAGRLQIIQQVGDEMEQLSTDLRQFTRENKLISLQRAHETGEIETLKRLYGLP